jgi:hypothetical protein
MSETFYESERIKSAISTDMFSLNYKYREGFEGYNKWLSLIQKEDSRHHRYGHLYEGYLEVYSLDYVTGYEKIFQVKPQFPVYKIENKPTEKKESYPEKGFLYISGTELVKLAKKAKLEHKLPHDKAGNLVVENISHMDEQKKYNLAKEINLFSHYKTKPIKYETIPNQELTNIFPLISDEAFISICKKQNITAIANTDYANFTQKERWDFFKKFGKNIKITEGHKKATSAISHGYLTIASASITTHSKPKRGGEDDDTEQKNTPIKDDLRLFFEGRDDWEVEIIFDVGDTKASTRKAVQKQSFTLAKKLNKYGTVFIRKWTDFDCKGLDDYLYKYHNLDATYRVFPSGTPKNSCLNKRLLTPDKTIEVNYLSTDLMKEARDKSKKLLFIKSTQNTGKTTIVNKEMLYYEIDLKYNDLSGFHVSYSKTKEVGLVIKMIDDDNCLVHFFNSEGSPLIATPRSELTIVFCQGSYPLTLETLVLTHRQTLATNLANKLNVRHYQDSRSDGYGEVICVDSILRENQLNHYTNGFVDEASQVMWHLLSSNTEIKSNRLTKIERIGALGKGIIENKGIITLVDADIDDNTVAFYCYLFGVSRQDCLVVENTFKPFTKRTLFQYKDCASWRQSVYDAINANKRVILHTSGQKHESTHGSYNVEKDLREHFPNKTVIRLDSTTLGDENHEAYRMLYKLGTLKNYDIIIASSSLNTGVDLTEPLIGTIDDVFGIYYGNYPLNDFEQSIERYRGDANRHVFLPILTNNKINIGSTSSNELYENIIGHSQVITAMFGIESVCLANNLVGFYANCASVINYEYSCLSESFYTRAIAKGYNLELGDVGSATERRIIRKHIKEIKVQSISEYSEQVVTSPEIDELEARRIENKLNQTVNEKLQLEKHILQKRYCLEEITTQIVEYNREYSAILNRYYLTANTDFVRIKDEKKLAFFIENNKTLYPIDINDSIKLPTLEAYKQLGIATLIDRIKVLSDFSVADIDSYIETLRNEPELEKTRLFVKQVLKIDVSKNIPPTRLFSMLLDRFGYSIKLIGSKREKGKAVRRYILISRIDEDFFSSLLDRWYERDSRAFREYFEDTDADTLYNYN